MGTHGTVHYREAGSGDRVLLLLHAFPLHSGMWELTPLAKAGWRVIAPDVRGFGKSAGEIAGMETIATDAAAILDELGVKKAVIGGCSMGGYALFELWRRRRDLFRGMLLADTRAGADTAEAAANRETFAKNALEKGIGWVASEMAPKLQRVPPLPAADAALRTMIAEGTAAGVAAAQRAMAKRADSKGDLAKIDVPALIVVGAEDKLTPPAESKAMHEAIRGSQLVEIPKAGHVSNVEEPDAFAGAVAGWLATLR